MKPTLLLALAATLALWSLQARAQPAPVNVLQDCWTTNQEADPDLELELYDFTTDDPITFVWKQKLLQSCSAYLASIYAVECVDGKPRPGAVEFSIIHGAFGSLDPDPAVPEPLLSITAPAGSVPVGSYDWMLLVECNDTNGTIRAPGPNQDGNVDDQCGLNVGFNRATGLFPVLYGPEPLQVMDPDPGGAPPGRAAGESGTTRPWCFEVSQAGCAPQTCGTFTDCDPGPGFCACAEIAEGGGICMSSFSCSNTPCPGGTADCPAGQVCTVNTCCGGPVCAPPQCGATAPGGFLGPDAFGLGGN